jgi:hypothetical protein
MRKKKSWMMVLPHPQSLDIQYLHYPPNPMRGYIIYILKP